MPFAVAVVVVIVVVLVLDLVASIRGWCSRGSGSGFIMVGVCICSKVVPAVNGFGIRVARWRVRRGRVGVDEREIIGGHVRRKRKLGLGLGFRTRAERERERRR